jgi:hypothetical protein
MTRDSLQQMTSPASYKVETDEGLRWISPVSATRRDPTRTQPAGRDPAGPDMSPSDPSATPPDATAAGQSPVLLPRCSAWGVVRGVWRIVVRILEMLGPHDPPHVIAVIRAPERMHCASCGTERVAKYCPICGENVDRQYRKMVKKLARYVVDGTADRRKTIEAALAEAVNHRVNELAEQQSRLVQERLALMERQYVMEVARHRKAVQQLMTLPTAGSPGPAVLRQLQDQTAGESNTAGPPVFGYVEYVNGHLPTADPCHTSSV